MAVKKPKQFSDYIMNKPKINQNKRFIIDGDRLMITDKFTPDGIHGETGSISWDASFIYVCISAGVWKKVALVAL